MKPTPLDEEPIPPGLTPAQWASVVAQFELSRQQARVLALVAADYKEQAIALRLGIRPDTVKEYMKRIRLRLGARNRAALVRCIYTTAHMASVHRESEVSPDEVTRAKVTGRQVHPTV